MSHADAYYARWSDDGWQPLRTHLQNVSRLSGELALACLDHAEFVDAAGWAGFLHDLGKYREEFQKVLRESAQGTPGRGPEHSGQGAAFAFEHRAWDIAMAIAGHHAGLDSPKNVKERKARHADVVPCLRDTARADMPECRYSSDRPPSAPKIAGIAMDLRIRMLFSCLVDADRTDASGFPYAPRVLREPLALLNRLLECIQARADSMPDGSVKRARAEVLDSCLAAADWPQRLLSLTVPTGGGKTLASMAFALRRAVLRPGEVRRIIIVVPFLSIIEQNARVFAQALGEDAILEHHSGDTSRLIQEKGRYRLQMEDEAESPGKPFSWKPKAIENWNAPIVVTTSVRFFESLFSNHPTDLRRMHNIARSVVILDEVQILPRTLLRALLSMIRGLAEDWSTTFVFCTATQPAFEKPDDAPEEDPRWRKGTVTEIVPQPQRVFHTLRRVNVSWPVVGAERPRIPWDALAERLAAEARVLCVVNLKAHAALVYQLLRRRADLDGGGLWHLSTRMCPRHRLEVFDGIRAALSDEHRPCRVVSTQLVEAGVDLDFPVVYRAMAPLDSIAQAAGRCDREGFLTAAKGAPAGRVVVFEPDVEPGRDAPPGAYREAMAITRAMASAGVLDIQDTGHIRGYFNRYYQSDLDPNDIEPLRAKLDFREVSGRFTLIDDRSQAVFVPYDELAMGLIRVIEKRGAPELGILRRLQRYQVGLYPSEFEEARRKGAVYEIVRESGLWACERRFYSAETGLGLECDDPLIA